MNWTTKIKPDTLTKVLFLVFFVASGLLVFLFLQLGNKNQFDKALAEGPYDHACGTRTETGHECPSGQHTFEIWCNNSQCNESPGNCVARNVHCVGDNSTPTPTQGLPTCSSGNYGNGQCQCGGNTCYIDNPTCDPTAPQVCTSRDNIDYPGADDRDPRKDPNASCRYATGGGHCAKATFYSGCSPDAGKICVCTGGTPGGDGWSYGTTDDSKSIDGYMDCGIDTSRCSDPANFGKEISGNAAKCRNPWKYLCPGTPQTPTPTQPGQTPTPTATPTRPGSTPTPTTTVTPSPTVTVTITPPPVTITPPTPPRTNLTCDNLNVYNSAGNLLPQGAQLIPGNTYRIQVNSNTNPNIGTRYAWSLNGGAYTLIPNPDQNPANCATKGNNFNDNYNPRYIDFTVPTTMQAGQTISFTGATVFKIVNNQLVNTTATACPDNDSNTNVIACGAPNAQYPNGATAYRTGNGYVTDVNSVTQNLTTLNTTCTGSALCQKTFTIAAQPQQLPNIEVVKTLVSPNFQPVGSTIVFNISARNTGNVAIRNFTLSDNFDPNYLEFLSSSFGPTPYAPDTPTGQIVNGRRVLTWSNMPPKSDRIPNEDGVLTIGETVNLTVTFRILKETTPALALENDNCGVISTIQYQDTNGTTVEVPITPPKSSCVEYQTPTQVPLTVVINKSALTPSVVSPAQVKFRAVIVNNDTQKRTYSDIDFTDEYDSTYLKPNNVIVTNPAGRQATLTGFANSGVLSIANLQDQKDANGVALGALPYGQTYTLDLIFDSMAPIHQTCDTVFTNVGDTGGNGGVSNEAKACAEITAPPPPVTGANMFFNLMIPALAIIATGAANLVLLKKYN